MATTYVEITKAQMEDLLINQMGFTRANDDLMSEYVYQRDVTTTSGVEYPYMIRVYSSVKKQTGVSDECGADAIRVVLFDKVTGRPAKKTEKRVHRTKNALPNLRNRCRTAFKFVLEAEKCDKCNSVMIERENGKTGHKFLSCSRWGPNTPHHCTGTKQRQRRETC